MSEPAAKVLEKLVGGVNEGNKGSIAIVTLGIAAATTAGLGLYFMMTRGGYNKYTPPKTAEQNNENNASQEGNLTAQNTNNIGEAAIQTNKALSSKGDMVLSNTTGKRDDLARP